MTEARELLHGAYDLHVHTSPDILPRKLDDMEMAKRAVDRGMAGFAIKSHYFCTAQRAELVHKVYPSCRVIGSITLNASVGGINPAAVEMAARAGAKIVWFPTCDAAWEQEQAALERDPAQKPFWVKIVEQLKEAGIRTPAIKITKEGKLIDAAYEVLDIIARNHMIVATGHISHQETFALAKGARERGVDRVIVTHVNFPSTFYTIDEQKELVRNGAIMEHCYTTYATGKVPLEVMVEQMRAVGPDHVLLGTDLGQKSRVFPDEGMGQFVSDLYQNGFTEKEIRRMTAENSRGLLT